MLSVGLFVNTHKVYDLFELTASVLKVGQPDREVVTSWHARSVGLLWPQMRNTAMVYVISDLTLISGQLVTKTGPLTGQSYSLEGITTITHQITKWSAGHTLLPFRSISHPVWRSPKAADTNFWFTPKTFLQSYMSAFLQTWRQTA